MRIRRINPLYIKETPVSIRESMKGAGATGWYLPGVIYEDEIPKPGPIEQAAIDAGEVGFPLDPIQLEADLRESMARTAAQFIIKEGED